jgi:hypothetical protein
MTKFTTAAVAALGLALVASTPAFAGGRVGGPDAQNPIAHEGVAANGPQIQVWGGEEVDTRPTVSADAVTGTSSNDVVATTNAGRFTYRVVKVHQPSENAHEIAADQYITFING